MTDFVSNTRRTDEVKDFEISLSHILVVPLMLTHKSNAIWVETAYTLQNVSFQVKTINFTLLYIIRNQDVQRKFQQEIDSVVGRERLPVLEDRTR